MKKTFSSGTVDIEDFECGAFYDSSAAEGTADGLYEKSFPRTQRPFEQDNIFRTQLPGKYFRQPAGPANGRERIFLFEAGQSMMSFKNLL